MTRHAFFAFALLALSSLPAYALSPGDAPELARFIDDVAAKHGFSKDVLTDWFEDVELREDILQAIARPAEALPWYEYKKRFVTEDSVRRGVEYWRRNAQALERAAAEYGVPPQLIVAVLGIETRYGANLGRYPVMDALTTLMLKAPSRRDYFRQELEEFLLLTRELKLDPRRLKGSYTGALGIPQFMPSSYRVYAVDFDDDKKREILLSNDDAIGSVANYFKQNGWRRGERVVDTATAGDPLPEGLQNLGQQPTLRLSQLRKQGIVTADSIDGNLLAAPVSLEEEKATTYRVAYHNFFVILRYNRSKHYAMAVYELSEQLRLRYADMQAKRGP